MKLYEEEVIVLGFIENRFPQMMLICAYLSYESIRK